MTQTHLESLAHFREEREARRHLDVRRRLTAALTAGEPIAAELIDEAARLLHQRER